MTEKDLRQLRYEAYNFSCEFLNKFLVRAKERNRSLQPWQDFKFIELFERLDDEKFELYEEIISEDLAGIMDECIDVANFAWFMYQKAEKELKEQR